VHYSLLTRPGFSSFCDVNTTISCTQAYMSRYGSIFGVPVALAGMLFFAIVLAVAGLAGRGAPQTRENAPAYIFAFATIGLAFVMYLAWASFFKLNAVCLLCVATYAAVVGVFLVSGAATSFSMTALPRRASKDAAVLVKSPLALVLTLVFAVGFISLVSAFPREAGTPSASAEPVPQQYPALTDQQKYDLVRWYEVQPKVDLPADAGGAKVVLVKFNDFQCPACRETHVAYKPLFQKYAEGGRFKYVLKHYPLEPECNAGVPGGTHRAACEAAAAIEMAEGTGTADKLEDWLFTNMTTLSRETVKRGAAEVSGINDYDARYTQALTAVRADADLGTRLNVNSTPTLFLNGRKIAMLPPPALEVLIEHELKR
jgi:uncharacterized membrane protein/protein-disulfide isomerase